MGSKKLWLPLLLLLMVMLVVWSGLREDEPDSAKRGIALIMKTNDINNSYWQTVHSGALSAAKELNVPLELYGPLGKEDPEAQRKLLKKAIARKPAAIVLSPIWEDSLKQELAECRRNGIKLVILDTPLLENAFDSYVSSDHIEEGRQAANRLGPGQLKKPVYALITNDKISVVSSQRAQGVQEVLAPGKAFNLGLYHVGGSEEQAYWTVKSLTIAYPDITGVIALTDVGVSGAARALAEVGLTHSVKLIGFDSSIPEIQLLERGQMHALIVQNPFNMGFLGVQTADALIDGRKVSEMVDIPSTTVTTANMYEPEHQKLLFPFVY
ncbi:substrate-binding domain-containing protein [Paenibacillus pasadenensis]|uniref:substrate-binding domain-containing protein n=1 Tax=Paenibacillus pasadenensis TaxID=217090 RepID=UPI00203FFBB5|nr:substrate-binding domain-containing protein [Paenibacillus pasadenensis]MCM3746909.1 substrate-binding domain-containing protein [Paenibacillus pasadenensis]